MKITKKENNKIEITLDNGCVVEVEEFGDDNIMATVDVTDDYKAMSKRQFTPQVKSMSIDISDAFGINSSIIHTSDAFDAPNVAPKSITRKTHTLKHEGEYLCDSTQITLNKNIVGGFKQSILTNK